MLYLDLDGVLANFTEGVSEEIWKYATGRKEIIGSKSAPRKIRKYLKEHGRSFKMHTEDTLKQKEVKSMLYLVCSQKGFFLNLPQLPTELLDEVERMGVEYQFLTAGIGQYSVEDKQEWCQKVLGRNNKCNVVVSDGTKSTAELKAQFCTGSNDILVDDNLKNVEAWRDAGGTAIHWTGPESLQEVIALFLNEVR